MTTAVQPATKQPNVTQQLDALFEQVGPMRCAWSWRHGAHAVPSADEAAATSTSAWPGGCQGRSAGNPVSGRCWVLRALVIESGAWRLRNLIFRSRILSYSKNIDINIKCKPFKSWVKLSPHAAMPLACGRRRWQNWQGSQPSPSHDSSVGVPLN
jgi:hypothetical protein